MQQETVMVMTSDMHGCDRSSVPAGDQAILRMIHQTDRMSGLFAGAILFLIVGPPVMKALLDGHPVYAIINAIALSILALVLIAILEVLILKPIATLRYHRAARAIEHDLAMRVANPVLRWSAHRGTPGVLAIARGIGGDHLLLCDLSTRYRWISIRCAQVLDTRPVVQIRHGRGSKFSFGVGVPVGGGLIMPLPLGAGRPKAPTVRFAVMLTISHDSGIDGGTTYLRCRDAEHAQTLTAQIAHWATTSASHLTEGRSAASL
jgi:hypothetical protein